MHLCLLSLLCLQGMEALQASGKVKSIGVSNFSILQLERLLALCKVPPAVNQVLNMQLHYSTPLSHLYECMKYMPHTFVYCDNTKRVGWWHI